MADYKASLDRLRDLGVLYRCFKTRKELLEGIASAPHSFTGPEPVTPLSPHNEAELLATGKAFAWRLSLQRSQDLLGADWDQLGFEANGIWVKANPAQLGDIVLARKEFPSSYHLASVLDDATQGITHVIRGEDLAEAAHIHVVLQKLLALPTPVYHHHRLILDVDGKRFAKRNQSVTLRSLRESGTSPAEIRTSLGL
jgi:glutamyl-Q tRNA(Asp) synthetase